MTTGVIFLVLLMTYDTVASETPACFATSFRVAITLLPPSSWNSAMQNSRKPIMVTRVTIAEIKKPIVLRGYMLL